MIEETSTGFSAYSPDVQGCVATSATRSKVEKAMKSAIEFHLEGMLSEQIAFPAPHSYSAYVEVSG